MQCCACSCMVTDVTAASSALCDYPTARNIGEVFVMQNRDTSQLPQTEGAPNDSISLSCHSVTPGTCNTQSYCYVIPGLLLQSYSTLCTGENRVMSGLVNRDILKVMSITNSLDSALDSAASTLGVCSSGSDPLQLCLRPSVTLARCQCSRILSACQM